MSVPKGFKQTEVGVIPDDWETNSIENLIVPNGLIRGPFGGSLKKACFVKKGIKVYEQRNAIYKDEKIGRYYIDDQKYNELKRFEVYANDFIVSCSGTIGKIYQIPSKFEKGVINQALLKITIDISKYSDQYFYQFFQWDNFQNRIIESTQGGAMKNLIGMADFKKVLIPLPPTRAEQTAIAAALSDMDALIEGVEKLLEKKRRIKQGAMQELLTGKRRVSGFESQAGFQQTEVGVIPKDWKISDLESISLVPMQNGLFYEPKRKGSGVFLVNVGDMYKAAPIAIDKLDLFDATVLEIKNFCVKEGDIFFTRSSVVPGGIAYCNILPNFNYSDVVFDSHLIRVRANPNIMDARFLYLNCLAVHSRKYLVSSAKISTMTTIDQGTLKKCPVLVPTLAEQTAIAAILSDMDSEIQQLETQLTKYRQLKTGMMQELLTGKKRLV